MRYLFAIVALFFALSSPTLAGERRAGNDDVPASLRRDLVSLAHQVAGEMGEYDLDYSHRSVEDVEAILSDFHQLHVSTGQVEGLNGIAMEFAAYLIATIEKNGGRGRWEKDHPTAGENSFPFYWRGATLFPVEWCRKRIFDGEGDDVVSKYRVFVLAQAEKK